MDPLDAAGTDGGEEGRDRDPADGNDDAGSASTSPTAPSSYGNDGDGDDGVDVSSPPPPCPLRRAVEVAGLYASTFGVSSIELWVLRRRAARLERPDGGAWVDDVSSSASSPSAATDSNSAALAALEAGGVPPPAVPPGVGLPGALWSETGAVTAPSPAAVREWASMDDEERSEDLRRAAAGDAAPDGWNEPFRYQGEGAGQRGAGGGRRGLLKDLGRSIGHSLRHNLVGDRGVVWRELLPMARDPDRHNDARLRLYVEAGFALAAGVRFDIGGGHRGVVIFLAPRSADMRSLRSEECEAYLRHASGVISATYAQSLDLG